MSGSDEHSPAENRDALKRMADRVAFYRKPRYQWVRNQAVKRGAVSQLGGDAVGRIFHMEATTGASPRWRWDLAFDGVTADAQKFRHVGWATSALDAALQVESLYARLGGDDTD